jgi:RNA polymerase sigma factor FliA
MMQHAAIANVYTRNPKTGDVDALIKAHGQIVRRTAWHVHSRMSSAIEVEDLMQIGMMALVEAARSFEDRGIAFAPYAAMRIRGSMIDELRRDARMARAGMANRRKIAAARRELENRLGHPATPIEMAEAMGVDINDYHALLATTQSLGLEPIDDVYSDHDMWFADASENAHNELEQKQMRELLAENIAELGEREGMVLQLYFVEEMNLDEIGLTLGVGAARVCQIKKAALDKLRCMMEQGADC